MSDEIIEVTIYKPKRIPDVYRPPLGLPLNWKDETSGVLPRVVFKFFSSHQLTPDEISLIAEYCQHYINAPCWQVSEEATSYLAALRQAATLISSVDDLSEWINACLEIAIDPF
ncbi:hypothetical protein [Nostoc sp.]|uniref:hypothetical protein n=1 Tax=Nostoc sp. TaxID=1180 RepID=UPI002FEF5D23